MYQDADALKSVPTGDTGISHNNNSDEERLMPILIAIIACIVIK